MFVFRYRNDAEVVVEGTPFEFIDELWEANYQCGMFDGCTRVLGVGCTLIHPLGNGMEPDSVFNKVVEAVQKMKTQGFSRVERDDGRILFRNNEVGGVWVTVFPPSDGKIRVEMLYT